MIGSLKIYFQPLGTLTLYEQLISISGRQTYFTCCITELNPLVCTIPKHSDDLSFCEILKHSLNYRYKIYNLLKFQCTIDYRYVF